MGVAIRPGGEARRKRTRRREESGQAVVFIS
jgi:hypothetical protein